MENCNFFDYYMRCGPPLYPYASNCEFNSPNTVIVDANVSCSIVNGLRVFSNVNDAQVYLMDKLSDDQPALILIIPYTTAYPAFSILRNNTTISGLATNSVNIESIEFNPDNLSLAGNNRVTIKTLSVTGTVTISSSSTAQNVFSLLNEVIFNQLVITNNNANFYLVLENSLVDIMDVEASSSQLIMTGNFVSSLSVASNASVLSSNDAFNTTTLTGGTGQFSNAIVRGNPFSTDPNSTNANQFILHDNSSLTLSDSEITQPVQVNSNSVKVILTKVVTNAYGRKLFQAQDSVDGTYNINGCDGVVYLDGENNTLDISDGSVISGFIKGVANLSVKDTELGSFESYIQDGFMDGVSFQPGANISLIIEKRKLGWKVPPTYANDPSYIGCAGLNPSSSTLTGIRGTFINFLFDAGDVDPLAVVVDKIEASGTFDLKYDGLSKKFTVSGAGELTGLKIKAGPLIARIADVKADLLGLGDAVSSFDLDLDGNLTLAGKIRGNKINILKAKTIEILAKLVLTDANPWTADEVTFNSGAGIELGSGAVLTPSCPIANFINTVISLGLGATANFSGINTAYVYAVGSGLESAITGNTGGYTPPVAFSNQPYIAMA